MHCFVIIFQHFADHFSGNFWNPSWSPFLDQIGPREAKMNPRGPSRASKSQKTAFSKKWFSRGTFTIFSLLGPPKRASRGPRRLPKDTQRTPRPQKKGTQNWTQKLSKLGQILEQFWDQNDKLKNQKNTHFWDLLPPHLRGPNNAPPKKTREG